MTIDVKNLIVGAGPAGLAMAASLKHLGQEYCLFERSDTISTSWKNHYERLHLHTSKTYSALPYTPFPKDYPTYPSRGQVVQYLENYAAVHGIKCKLNTEVKRCSYGNGAWSVQSNQGLINCQNLIIATGYNHQVNEPTWPGKSQFTGQILHSKSYRNAKRFAAKRVLIVGLGNTGGEIAIDLAESGAQVSLSCRSPIHVMPRDFLGQPGQKNSIQFQWLPLAIRDFLGTLVSRLAYGPLTSYGLSRPKEGPVSQIINHQRIPLIDIGTLELIKKGHIKIYPAIKEFTPTGVEFVNDAGGEFDCVVLATGYRPGVQGLFPDLSNLCDTRGYPLHNKGVSSFSGLYFIGFSNPETGFLRQIALDAQSAAQHIDAKT